MKFILVLTASALALALSELVYLSMVTAQRP